MEESWRDSFTRFLRRRPFRAPWWLRSGHLQTLASQWRRDFSWSAADSRETLFRLSSGALVRVEHALRADSRYALVVVHGMGGSSASLYMQGFLHKAWRLGWSVLLLNLYDVSGSLGKPRIFTAGASGPLAELIESLQRAFGPSSVFLCGVSKGGNIVLKLLAERSSSLPARIVRAAVLSPLVDLTVSWRILDRPSNFLYRRHYVGGLKTLLRRHYPGANAWIDPRTLARVRTIREYDEEVTAPLTGHRDAFEYYERAGSLPLLSKVRVPTFILHSRDDPLLPWEPLTRREVLGNSSLLVHLTRRGGHTGFLEAGPRRDMDRRWGENRILDFFRSEFESI